MSNTKKNIHDDVIGVFSDSSNYSETRDDLQVKTSESTSKDIICNDLSTTSSKSRWLCYKNIVSLLLIACAIAALIGADNLYNYSESLEDVYYGIAHLIMFPIFLVGGLIISNK